MCHCINGCKTWPCFCSCHKSQIIGPSRSGKMTAMLLLLEQLQWERDHPAGVVPGAVVTDSGELEAGPA